jgi:hypothetical protein
MRIDRNGPGTAMSWVLILTLIVLSPHAVSAAGAQGTIKVVTEPAGAEVFIGDQRKGVTPLVIDGLPPASTAYGSSRMASSRTARSSTWRPACPSPSTSR